MPLGVVFVGKKSLIYTSRIMIRQLDSISRLRLHAKRTQLTEQGFSQLVFHIAHFSFKKYRRTALSYPPIV